MKILYIYKKCRIMINKIKKLLLVQVLILLIATIPTWSQPFAIGHTTINFIDSSRNNRSIATEIYYPSDTAGNNVPMTISSLEKFPTLTFGHGFVMTWDAYQNIWEAIVTKGYIMAFPKTEGSISPSHAEYGKDLAFVSAQIFNLGMLQSTIFFDRVSLMNAVMGHSMGGGAAFLAPQYNSNIKTIITLAAAETNPSAIAAAGSLLIPALVVAGANDCVTPPSTNQEAMYNSLGSNCKTYILINGGSHCQMANSNFFCNFGESTCTPQPTITRDEQHIVLDDYLILWLDAQLKSDCLAGQGLNNLLSSDSRVTFQKNCIQCEPLSVTNAEKTEIVLYPNPFSSLLNIKNPEKKRIRIKFFDSASRVLQLVEIMNEQDYLNTSLFASGIYGYEILSDDGFTKKGKIIKN